MFKISAFDFKKIHPVNEPAVWSELQSNSAEILAP